MNRDKKESGLKPSQQQKMEKQLLDMQLDQNRLQAEFDRIPDNAKTIAQRRRKAELERELQIAAKSVSTLRNKLRDMKVLY